MSSPGRAVNSGSSAVSEKVRTRLEELDDLEEVGWSAHRLDLVWHYDGFTVHLCINCSLEVFSTSFMSALFPAFLCLVSVPCPYILNAVY